MRMRTVPISIVVFALFLTLIVNVGEVYSRSEGSAEDVDLAQGEYGSGWAVLLEVNDFPPGWVDLPMGFVNSERMRTALLSLGWRSDHLLEIRDNVTISVVQDAVDWLVNNAGSGDVALLYIFAHGLWLHNVLFWNDWFPAEWRKVSASCKVLIVDTCFAEEFIKLVRDDPLPHISLAACSEYEATWAGVEAERLPIIGSVWNYFFTNALLNASADLDGSGAVSVEEAFDFSVPLVQGYMNETVFTVPEFLAMYHRMGFYPENYDAYPHPVMDDQYAGQLFIPEFPSFLMIISLLATATALAAIACRRQRDLAKT